MKALIGVASLTDVAPSSVISEMERLAEKVLVANGQNYARTPEDERPEDFETPDGFALTECEHGVHVDSPSPCKVCGAQ